MPRFLLFLDYGQFDLADGEALKVTAFAGEEQKLELQIGRSGSRGQMVRVSGSEGVYTLDGFSSYLYDRPLKDWRDKKIVDINPDDVQAIQIENQSGKFDFNRKDDTWKAGFKATKPGLRLTKFDPQKIDDLLRAYKELKAFDFIDQKPLDSLGLQTPVATLKFLLSGGQEVSLRFGDAAESNARAALYGANPQIFAVGSWSADWAVAEPAKFEETSAE